MLSTQQQNIGGVNAKLQEFNDLVQVEHGSVDMRDDYLFGLLVKRAYIITSRRPVVPAAK